MPLVCGTRATTNRSRAPVPYQREGEIVLAAWREVERKLEIAEEGDRASLQAEAARLWAEYHELIDAARTHHRPEPPPFPTEDPRRE
jgi:hypothetical protein